MTTSEPRPIIFIHSSNEMYGSDRMLLRVLTTLPEAARQGCEVWLPDDVAAAGVSLEAELRAHGIRVRVVPLPILRRSALHGLAALFSLAGRMVSLWRRLRRTGPAAVYCATSATLLAAPVARLAGCGEVILHAQEIWRRREGLVLALLGASCTRGVAISRAVLDSLRGRVARTTRLIENATETSPQPLTPMPPGPLRFVVASRWNAWKGHRTLLTAWGSLALEQAELEVLGGPPLAGEQVDVPALVSALPNSGSVTVTGETSDITAAIDRAHFVVVPSDDPEPFGLVAIEAFSRGRAVIASDAGGLADIVTDRVTGRLFPPRDAAALAEILSSLDVAHAAALGAAAHTDFEQRYSMRRFSDAFGELWSQVDGVTPSPSAPSRGPRGRRPQTSRDRVAA